MALAFTGCTRLNRLAHLTIRSCSVEIDTNDHRPDRPNFGTRPDTGARDNLRRGCWEEDNLGRKCQGLGLTSIVFEYKPCVNRLLSSLKPHSLHKPNPNITCRSRRSSSVFGRTLDQADCGRLFAQANTFSSVRCPSLRVNRPLDSSSPYSEGLRTSCVRTRPSLEESTLVLEKDLYKLQKFRWNLRCGREVRTIYSLW